MLDKIISIYFGLMGSLAIVIVLFAIVYTYYHLLIRKKIIGILFFSVIIGLFMLEPSLKIITYCAAFSLVANSVFYIVFASGSLFKKDRLKKTGHCPTVSILIPAKNEAKVLEDTLISLSGLDYPESKLEIILIDDNSTDQTYKLCISLRQKILNLKVIRNKVSLGKAKALNEVLKKINSEYTVILDADHLAEKSFIRKALRNFTDPKVACVQGKNVIRNGHVKLLSRLIQIEYSARYEILYPGKKMAFFMGSGAMFRTSCLKEVDGFNENMLTEDLEVSYRLYEKGRILVFDNTLATHELATEDFRNYYKQRHRWFRGIWQSFLSHFTRMAVSEKIPTIARIYFLQVILENMALTSYLFFSALFVLNLAGLTVFNFKYILFAKTIVLAIVLSLAIIKAKKNMLFLYILCMPFYYIIYALPNLTAMIDNWIIKAEYKWIKTDRSKLDKEVKVNPEYIPTEEYEEEPETVETTI